MPKMDEAEVLGFLDEPGHLVRIANVDADGWPRVVPTWFVRQGDDIVFTPRAPAVFLANIRRDPRIALTVGGVVLSASCSFSALCKSRGLEYRCSSTVKMCLQTPSEFFRKSGQSQLPPIGSTDSTTITARSKSQSGASGFATTSTGTGLSAAMKLFSDRSPPARRIVLQR